MAEHWRVPPRNERLAPRAYRDAEQSVFITIRATTGRAPFRETALNDAVIGALRSARTASRCEVYAYCLMPDHFHMVAAPRRDGADVRAFVDRFKSSSTRIAWTHGHNGRLWQPRYYDHVLRREESVFAVCEYILMNPVRARLVDAEADYRWSGLLDPFDW